MSLARAKSRGFLTGKMNELLKRRLTSHIFFFPPSMFVVAFPAGAKGNGRGSTVSSLHEKEVCIF